MNYNIRMIRDYEHELLNNFLYEAIFIPEGVQAPPETIINLPELQVYVADFGKKKENYAVKMYKKLYRKWDNVKHISNALKENGRPRKAYQSGMWGLKDIMKKMSACMRDSC